MQRLLNVALIAAVNMVLAAASANALTFDEALDRALKARAIPATAFPRIAAWRTIPAVRAEATAQRAENIDVVTKDFIRFDAMTLLLTVDYPLLNGAATARRLADARATELLFQRRALDEADAVFRETLDAFSKLYVAQQRLALVANAVQQAADLRRRAQVQLELGEISNVVAASWQEQALATESQALDLDLRRLEAETRLRQLTGDSTEQSLVATLDVDALPPLSAPESADDAAVDRASIVELKKRLAFEDLVASRKPQLLATAFGGFASVPGSLGAGDGTFGLYGFRLTVSLPSRDIGTAARIAEARAEAEEAARARAIEEKAARERTSLMALSMGAAQKRVELLERSIEIARQREESVSRLVLAGVRTQSDLVEAATEVARRESDLLETKVERWRLARLAQHLQAQQAAAGAAAPGESR